MIKVKPRSKADKEEIRDALGKALFKRVEN